MKQTEDAAGPTDEQSPAGAVLKPGRSIREMVIDNNTRFAATMKSLGE
ncbi:hypothetical protein [Labrenzia sp. VG12]|nr:hypothetical protein [Labrenzia sp. VG12]